MSESPTSAIEPILARIERPRRAVVTAGMPYANGPLHIGHLAGAQVPADIYARWLGMLIGRDNVLYVCGTDDHGSTSELAAMQAGKPIGELIDGIHDAQQATLERYAIGLDTYSGTSRPECFGRQTALTDRMLRKLHANGMLETRKSQQWYDPQLERFLADRFVRGRCPNPKCDNADAYGDECDRCGHQHDPTELLEPRSAVSEATPELRETTHLHLDMWAVAETMRVWIEGKKGRWRSTVIAQVLDQLLPSLRIAAEREPDYKELKASLPKHKQRYARGKEVVLQFANRADFDSARDALAAAAIEASPVDEWAHRSITRDTPWGVPIPELEPGLAGKTLYVWPDSLIAPISFCQVALESKGLDPEQYRDYFCDPEARVYQFLGQDNVFFYVLMQGALWLGSQDDPQHLPRAGELQLTEIFGSALLTVGGEKMSKSRGNFYTADQLLDEKGYEPDQIRYYLSLLGLAEKPSSFDFEKLDERNAFLAGPMNAAIEKPISAAHSKFGGRVPEGTLDAKIAKETVRIVQRYAKSMARADYPNLLFEIERYARTINSLFARYKPHDDRHPEASRADALYSSFFVLKNLMIMLYPFAPTTMERVRQTLQLPEEVFRVEELGTGLPAGHAIGAQQSYFPAVTASE
ncbi:MAG: class I tRNA ligase family protein [Myxococcales bacterium]|nr:class I tRNA ligase family protein [Myxococcales bacterium]